MLSWLNNLEPITSHHSIVGVAQKKVIIPDFIGHQDSNPRQTPCKESALFHLTSLSLILIPDLYIMRTVPAPVYHEPQAHRPALAVLPCRSYRVRSLRKTSSERENRVDSHLDGRHSCLICIKLLDGPTCRTGPKLGGGAFSGVVIFSALYGHLYCYPCQQCYCYAAANQTSPSALHPSSCFRQP